MSRNSTRRSKQKNAATLTYRVVMTLLLPLIAIGFCLRSIKQKAYRQRLSERFGQGPKIEPNGILIHGASVGEIISLSPFVERCLTEFSSQPITLTSFTPTGSEQIRARFAQRVQHCYLPIDAPVCVRAFLAKIQPKTLVLMETELWPSLITEAKITGVNILLINGRISERSFPRYKKLRPLIGPCLRLIDKVQAQSERDLERFTALGARAESCEFGGNLKYDLSVPGDIQKRAQQLRLALGKRSIWVVGSSHEDEESLIFTSLEALQRQLPDVLLVLAPRHPERYQALRAQARERQLSVISRSEAPALPSDKDAIWLIDTMGELLLFYALADVCTIAGSFGNTGGHNPIEAAYFSKPIIVGRNTRNFSDATEQLRQAKGLVQLKENSAQALSAAVAELIAHPERAKALGENALTSIEKNRGATQRALDALSKMS